MGKTDERTEFPSPRLCFYLGFIGLLSPQETYQCYMDTTFPSPSTAHFWSYFTFLLLQDLLVSRRDSCPSQLPQPTAHGLPSLQSFA